MTGPTQIKISAISDEMFTRLDDMKSGQNINGLIYGAAGTGKTELLGSYGSRSLYIDCGDSQETLKSVTGFKSRHKTNPIIVSVYERLNKEGFPESDAFDMLCDIIDYGLNRFKDDIDCVCVDDMTAIRRFAMNKAMNINSGDGREGKSLAVSQKHNVLLPSIQDFGVEMSIIKFFFGTYVPIMKQQNKHFFVSAHERLITKKAVNTQGKPIMGEQPVIIDIRPGFTGQTFPDEVTGFFDNVWHTAIKGSPPTVLYYIDTQGSESLTAKSRNGGIFKHQEYNPSLDKMIERIQKNIPAPKN